MVPVRISWVSKYIVEAYILAQGPNLCSRYVYAEGLLTRRYRGTNTVNATMAATGMERLNTKAFQFDRKALPGRARYDMLLTNVANIDMLTTHGGSLLLPRVKAVEVLFFR